MTLAVDVAGLVAVAEVTQGLARSRSRTRSVAEVDEQVLAGATAEAGGVPRGLGRAVRRQPRHDHSHATGLDANAAAAARLRPHSARRDNIHSFIYYKFHTTNVCDARLRRAVEKSICTRITHTHTHTRLTALFRGLPR